jgi:hypothetical protein
MFIYFCIPQIFMTRLREHDSRMLETMTQRERQKFQRKRKNIALSVKSLEIQRRASIFAWMFPGEIPPPAYSGGKLSSRRF